MEDFFFNREGLHRKVQVRCQNYVAACRIAAASDLLLTLPRRYAGMLAGAAAMHLPLLTMPLEMPGMDIHLYWHRQSEEEPANQWLRAQLQGLSLLAPGTARQPEGTVRSSRLKPGSNARKPRDVPSAAKKSYSRVKDKR
jgi:hypothetical protein